MRAVAGVDGEGRALARALVCLTVALAGCPKPEAAAPAKPEPAKPAAAKPASPAPAAATPASPAAPTKEPPPGPPVREASRQDVEHALEVLVEEVKAGASDPKNPWALAHGLLAFGPDLKASDGRLAIDVMVHDFILVEQLYGRTVHRFPQKTKDDVPVEPHPNLIAKSMVSAGVPLTRSFKLKGGKSVTLKQLVDDAAWAFSMPTTDADWHQFAWSMDLFLSAYGPKGTLETHVGPIQMSLLVQQGLQKLENEQGFLLGPMRVGRPDLVEKRRQDIYGHTCGGLHFVQGAVHGAAAVGDPALLFRAGKQLELVDFRWDAERRMYRQLINTQPKYGFLLLVQELKFHGHVLETMALAHQWGALKADDATRAQARRVAADLVDAVAELAPMYKAQAKLAESTPQTYYDLIGDGCHAIRGLRQALVAFYAPPAKQ